MRIYCPLHHSKVEVKDFTTRIVTVNHGQRKMVEGICPTHKTHVAMYVPMNPPPPAPKKKRKKPYRSPWATYS
jgi:hypothetical protein